ncbi:MAG TPA: SRPBCC family protein [Flavipsychrobacter sp.]|nr:SRPBCC family protein [Flavipsychrobacter sp.]
MPTKKQYSFITRWQIKAPVEIVWETMFESERWSEWWKSVISVTETVPGDEMGIGSIRSYTLISPMRYRLTFQILLTERETFRLLKGKVTGQLDGVGSWHFSESDEVTTVECHWQVATTVKWMNRFAFLLAPLFVYNHNIVMKQGAKGLAKKLNAQLISC